MTEDVILCSMEGVGGHSKVVQSGSVAKVIAGDLRRRLIINHSRREDKYGVDKGRGMSLRSTGPARGK